MKIAIKNKSEWKYIDSQDLMIGNVRFGDIYDEVDRLRAEVRGLTKVLNDHFLVKKDNQYVVDVDGQLTLVKSLHLYEPPKDNINLKLYKVENGRLVIDTRKIGGAV